MSTAARGPPIERLASLLDPRSTDLADADRIAEAQQDLRDPVDARFD
jgi:hypothetical protein